MNQFGIDVSVGIWQGCVSILGQSSCDLVACTGSGLSCPTLNAARTFTLAAMIECICIAIMMSLYARRADYGNEKLLRNSKYAAVVCVLLLIIGVSCGIHVTTTGASWGAASFLAILSIIMSLAGTIAVWLIQ